MSKIDEILREHLVLATDDGQPYIKYTDDAIAQLLELVLEVIGEELEYEKYGKCPACNAAYMYQCTCDSGSRFTVIEQRQKAIKLFGGEDEPR